MAEAQQVEKAARAERGSNLMMGIGNTLIEASNVAGSFESNSTSSGKVFIPDSGSSTQSRNSSAKNGKYINYGNYRSLDNAYDKWESRLIHMKTYPEKYTEQEFEEVPSIQRKMKDIRKKNYGNGWD